MSDGHTPFVVMTNQFQFDESYNCANDWRMCSNNEQLIQEWNGLRKVEEVCRDRFDIGVVVGEPVYNDNDHFSYYHHGVDYIGSGILQIADQHVHMTNLQGLTVRPHPLCTFNLVTGEVVGVRNQTE
jgi:hypothetical protein